METVQSGELTDRLLVCLGRLGSHMTTCGGQYLLEDAPSVADILVWSSLYVVTSPEAATSKSKCGYGKGSTHEDTRFSKINCWPGLLIMFRTSSG